MEKLKKFLKDEDGVVLVEYALIGALIAVALVAAMTSLKNEIGNLFGDIETELSTAS